MKIQNRTVPSLIVFSVAFILIVGTSILMSGEGTTPITFGFPDDWSHHHVVFSNPGTPAEALGRGRFNEWYRTVTDPRYKIQSMKRARWAALSASPETTSGDFTLLPDISSISRLPGRLRRPMKGAINDDWQQNLGTYGATLAGGQSPAKFSFAGAAACSDYVVYPTGVTGSSSQASIVAFSNLYTAGASPLCTGPTTYWAYDVPGTVKLSPVLSAGGDQVAFVTTAGTLVLLKMAAGGTVTAPLTGSTTPVLTSATTANYRSNTTCPAPCYTTFSLGTTDSNSPPFYDYANDRMYVGDDGGNIHQYAGVFSGTPAVGFAAVNVTTSDSPKNGSSAALSGPVVDPSSGFIFVGHHYGYLHSLDSTGGTLRTSNLLDNVSGGGPGINDAPLIDVAGTAEAYVFVQNTSSALSYINQFPTGSTINATYGNSVSFTGNTGTQLYYAGTFDNLHTSTSNGNLYVCGVDSTNTNPTLYQIHMNATFGSSTVSAYYTPVTGAATCSQVTEYYNTGTAKDWLFLSVTANGKNVSGCSTTTGCLYNFDVTSGATTGSPTAAMNVKGGSSGIIVDNSTSGTNGGSEIYFYSLSTETCASGTSGCAIQASQAAP